MSTKDIEATTFVVDARLLDEITVTIVNSSPGRGHLTIACYGRAWTCWWGAMGINYSVEEFMTRVADPSYIASCLLRGNRAQITNAKQAKRDEKYVIELVTAVQQALRERLAIA